MIGYNTSMQLVHWWLKNAYSEVLGIDNPEFLLEKPAIASHGDWACAYSLSAFRALSAELKARYQSPYNLSLAVLDWLEKNAFSSASSAINKQFANQEPSDPLEINSQSENNQSLQIKNALNQPKLPQDLITFEVVKPGFINIKLANKSLWLNARSLLAQLSKSSLNQEKTPQSTQISSFLDLVLSDDQPINNYELPSNYAKNDQKNLAVVEYVSPNTNKPLHIGHLRNAALGSALSRVLAKNGQQVARAVVFNDRGLHIMKSCWSYLVFASSKSALLNDLKKGQIDSAQLLSTQETAKPWSATLLEWANEPASWLNPKDMLVERLQKNDHFVGFWYQVGDMCAQEEKVQEEWSQMLQTWEDSNANLHLQLRNLWQQMNFWFYEGFAQTQARYGFEFDEKFTSYESQIYLAGKQIVLDQAQKGILEKLPDGAVRANLAKFNLPNKILLRKDGTGIYMTFDIELTRQRSQLGARVLYWVVGADQILYFKQLFAVVNLLGITSTENMIHLAYGMVRLPEGKMSSRKGLVIYGDDLLDLAIEKAKNVMLSTNLKKNLSEVQFEAVATAVGIGAVKWTMLSVDATSDITFNIEESVSFKGFAGPYIQYTFARTQSILTKAVERNIANHSDILINLLIQIKDFSTEDQLFAEEIELLRAFLFYYETLRRSAQTSSLHHLCLYLYEVCQKFNAFYAQCPVLDEAQNESVINRRLLLVAATGVVLKDGLELLGIEPVPVM